MKKLKIFSIAALPKGHSLLNHDVARMSEYIQMKLSPETPEETLSMKK